MEVIGHKKIISFFERSIQKNSLAHAYLFSGPESVGKFTVARLLAQRLNLSGDQEINSNLVTLAPEIVEKKGVLKKLDIKVEQIRELERSLSLTSQGDHYRVAIIDQAHHLTKSAQNALLKTLEEPPAKTIIFLITKDKRKLLPTILSRCYEVRFKTLARRDMERMVQEGSADREELLLWSLGRPGLGATLLADKSELEKRQLMKSDLSNMLGADVVEKFAKAEEWSKDTVELRMRLDIWIMLLRECMLGNSQYANLRREKALLLIDSLSQAQTELALTNSNARLLVENILLDF